MNKAIRKLICWVLGHKYWEWGDRNPVSSSGTWGGVTMFRRVRYEKCVRCTENHPVNNIRITPPRVF